MEFAMTAFRSRTATEPLRRRYARRKALLLSCALGTGVALAVQPGTAQAQAINAQAQFSPFAPGTRTFTPGEGTETIRVSNPSTVINWSPTSTPTGDYEFLPAGNTVTFQGPGNYAVLNRIGITQPVRFDGTVISQGLDGSGAVTGIGGTILFSAPSGIIIGSTAIFDVGNLVLTTLGVSNLSGDDGYGNFDFVNQDGSIGFFNPDSAGGIVTEAGSQIRANAAAGGYVALVGATVDHGGSILVSGSAALVAADEATINLTPGQLGISTSYSQESRSVITRSGSVIDASSAPGGNVALTAPIVTHGGAIRVDGQAALVAGRSVEISVSQANGLFNIAVPVGATTDGDPPGQLTVTGTGAIGGPASTGAGDPHGIYLVATAQPTGADPITILLDGAIGFDPAGASVENGQIVIAAGYNVTDGAIETDPAQVNLDGPGFTGPAGAGNIQIDDGVFTSDITARAYGDIAIHGGTFTSMDAYSAERFIADTNNNSIDFSGDLNVTAAGGGYAYYGYDAPGFASHAATPGRTLRVRGDLNVTALAGFNYAEGQGETAVGGAITISADADGSVIVDGDATLDVSAEGFNSGAPGGYGQGGTVLVTANPGGTIQIGGDLDILASGTGGDAEGFLGGAGGAGYGGDARIYSDGGAVSIGGDLSIDLRGTGGTNDVYDGGYYGGVTGARGEGGTAGIVARNDGTIVVTGNSLVDASGRGGRVGDDNVDNVGGYGGGGGVFITASYGGSNTLSGTTDIDVTGIGGVGPNGGVGFGGRTNALAFQSGEITLTGALGMDARGIGGAANSDGAGTGGAGTGGYAGLVAVIGGSVTFGDANLLADGIGGDGVGAGGAGFGGVPDGEETLGAFIIAASGQVTGGSATLSASGTGGAASAGAGGAATGGDAEIDAYNGTQSAIVLSGPASLDVSARGGNGTTTGGAAQGGVSYAVAA
jgi:filamentous hemagglutinin family protein